MKKLLLLVAAISGSLIATAQEFRFGVKGGVNYADIAGKNLDKNSHRYKLGLHGGVMVNIQYPGTQVFSIQPELLYSRKGYENFSLPFEIRNNNNDLLFSAQEGGLVRLNYLDLPVMFNFKAGIIIFEVGPQLSYLVGMHNDATIRQTFPDETVVNTPSLFRRYEKERVRKFDAGIATGFRIETENGIGFGIRFNQGFIKLRKEETTTGTVPLAPDGFNQSFQLFASYLIPE